MSTSAFIPFCEFGGNMSVMGVKIEQFKFPVCNSFKPKLLLDQHCYEIDLNKFSDPNNVEKELKSGFAFIMDYNEDRQVTSDVDSKKVLDPGLVSSIDESYNNEHAFIHLDTVGMFITHLSMYVIQICFTEPIQLVGEGKYNLNVLKEISVTDSYLGLDQSTRRCQNEEPLNDCMTRTHKKNILQKCGCLPFNMRLSDDVWNYVVGHQLANDNETKFLVRNHHIIGFISTN